jgi:hypothetical protein
MKNLNNKEWTLIVYWRAMVIRKRKKDEIFIDEEENDREDEHKHKHKLPPLEFASPEKRTIEDNNGKL